MQVRAKLCATALALAAVATGGIAAPGDELPPVSVQVLKAGDSVVINASFSVPVPPKLAWDVLTDFNHMSNFISNVTFSSITEQHGNTLQVAQKGAANSGPLSFSFNSIRAIELKPFERITSHVISGSMKKLDGTTTLRAEGNGTRVVYHADSIPDTYVPPLIGPKFIESETRHQFEEMRIEMMRRRAPS